MHKAALLLTALLLALDLPPASSSVTPGGGVPIRYFPDVDSYDYEDGTTTRPPATPPFPPRECDHDACAAPAVPCVVMSARTRCYCPGITGPAERPLPPRLRELRPGERGELEVRWCAPQSTVTRYEVLVDGGGGGVFGEGERAGAVRGVEAGSRVCVVAVNGAGASAESEASCARYEAGGAGGVAVGVAVGGVASLALIAVAATALWRRRKSGKSGAAGGEGLGNPSYTTNEAL